MDHPEGVMPELDRHDDVLWHLGVYQRCLENWDMMNAALKKTMNDMAQGDPDEIIKLSLRYNGLSLLRDVDTGDNHA